MYVCLCERCFDNFVLLNEKDQKPYRNLRNQVENAGKLGEIEYKI
jgi:hypothetical protein